MFQRLFVLASVVSFFLSSFCFALEIPDSLKLLLVQKNRADLIARFNAIPQVSTEDLLKRLSTGNLLFLGKGFNGAGFGFERGVIKISHHVISSAYPDHGLWRAFLDQRNLLSFFREDNALNSGASKKEIFGNVLWSAYDVWAIRELPLSLTKDTMITERRLVDGVSFGNLLKLEASGKSVPYSMPAIWRKVSQFVRKSEKMLIETGLSVDLLNPSNFMISGPYDRPVVELIDHELIKPSKETIEIFKREGKPIHQSEFSHSENFVFWPLIPEQIVFNSNWSLNFEQSVMFIQSYFSYPSKAEAIVHLARVPELPVDFFPPAGKYENIRQAKDLTLSPCEKNLVNLK